MTYDQFKNKYKGEYIDYDGKYGSQCTDLMRAYVKEVYGLEPYKSIPTTGNAKDIYKNFKENQFFKRIDNTPTGVPKKGDIFFLGTYPFITGLSGHVGIVEWADVNSVILFHQNYPTGSVCTFRKFSYKGALGWLYRK